MSIKSRIDKLRKLENGWLDGKSKALDPDGLDWVQGLLESLDLPQRPYIFLTPDNNIQAEWDGSDMPWQFALNVKVEFNLKTKEAEMMVFIVPTSETTHEQDFQLQNEEQVEEFARILKEYVDE